MKGPCAVTLAPESDGGVDCRLTGGRYILMSEDTAESGLEPLPRVFYILSSDADEIMEKE